MKLELTDDEAKFLMRALVHSYAENESDYFTAKNISQSSPVELLVGKLVSKYYSLQEVYYEARKERFSGQEPFGKRLFLGSGFHSLLDINKIFRRINYAIRELGGEQQNGGMGTEYDEQSAKEADQGIKGVLKDLIFAFGYEPKDL